MSVGRRGRCRSGHIPGGRGVRIVGMVTIGLVFGNSGRKVGRLGGSHGVDGSGFGFLAVAVTVERS